MTGGIRRWAVAAALVGALGVAEPVSGAAAACSGPGCPTGLTARAAALLDPASGRLLYGYQPSLHLPVASLVKLMTARLALKTGALQNLAEVPPAVQQLPQTKVGLVPGQRVALSVLLPAMLIHSGNDAAYTVAVDLGGSEAAFAARMNAEAARLGLTSTHYVDSTGLDAPGQYSSARDVAVLAADDMALPGFDAIVDRSSVTMPGGATYGTVNPFLAYYPGASGIKTGFTSEAMFCLAASAQRDGSTLIAVVLGEPNWARTDADAAELLNWGFGHIGATAGAPATGPPPATAPKATAAAASPPVSATPPAKTPPNPPRPSPPRADPATPATVSVVPPAAPARTAPAASAQRAPPAATGAAPAPAGPAPRVWVLAALAAAALVGWVLFRGR